MTDKCLSLAKSEELAAEMLAKFDESKTGKLDRPEIKKLLSEIAAKWGVSFGPSAEPGDELVNQMMDDIDADKDGCLSQAEIAHLLRVVYPG